MSVNNIRERTAKLTEYACPRYDPIHSYSRQVFVMTKKSREAKVPEVSGVHSEHIREIVFSIRRLMQAGELYTKELNKAYNVSSAQLNCLLALDENGSLPISKIAKHIMVKSSTVTGILDRLEKKDLVRRIRVSTDRRVITVELTETGTVLATNAPSPIQQKIVDGLNRLSERQITKISGSLKKLTDMLDVQDISVI